MDRKHNVHMCTLPKSRRPVGLLPLAPTASTARRFLRFIRVQALIDVHNKDSRIFFRNKSSMFIEQKRQVRTCYWFIIHPFSKLSFFLDWLFVIVWFVTYICIPLQQFPAAYESWDSLEFDSVLAILQSIVIVSVFLVGYIDYKRKEIVLNQKRIAMRYLKSYLVFDIIIVVGTSNAQHILTGNDLRKVFILYTVVLLSMMVRFLSFLHTLDKIIKHLRFGKPSRFIIRHAALCFIMIHIFTIHVYSIPFFVYRSNFPQMSWIKQAKLEDSAGIPSVEIYYECQLNVICHFFGATYDRYSITLPCEEVIFAVIIFTGRMYTLYFVAEILKLFGLVNISESKYEQFIGQVEEYVNSKKLPEELRVRLLRYYELKLQRHYFNEAEILHTLSEQLKTEMFMFGAKRLFEKISIFQTLSRTAVAELLACISSETFLPGDIIFKAGVVTENIYFISWGTVALYHRNGDEIGHLSDGDEFGIDLPGEEVQRYTYMAVEISEIYYANRKVIMKVFSMYPQVWKHLQTVWAKKMTTFQSVEREMTRGDTVVELLKATNLLEGRQYKYETEYLFQ